MAHPASKNRARPLRFLIVAVILVLILIGAELVVRVVVGRIATDRIQESLPDSVSADVVARPTGWCVTCEVIAGEISELHVDSDPIAVDGLQGRVNLDARGIRFRDEPSANHLEGKITLTEEEFNDAIDQLAPDSGIALNDVTIRDDGIRYRTSFSAFGETITVDVTASVHTRGDGQLQIRGESLSLASGRHRDGINLDPGRFTVRMCIAEVLPQELEITSVSTGYEQLEIELRTRQRVPLDGTAFQTAGSCR